MDLILATQGRTFYICEFTLFLCTNKKKKKKDNVCFFLFKLYNYLWLYAYMNQVSC